MNKLKDLFKKIDKRYLTGTLLLIAGIALFLASGDTLATLVRIAGAVVIAVALIRFARLMKLRNFYKGGDRLSASLFNISLFNTGLLFILGAVMLVVPGRTLHLIFAVIGGYLVLNAAIHAYYISIGIKQTGDILWWSNVILTALTFILGLWLVFSPSEVSRMTEIIAGASMVVKAIELMTSAEDGKPKKKKKNQGEIEADFVDKSNER